MYASAGQDRIWCQFGKICLKNLDVQGGYNAPAAEKEQYFGARQGKNLACPVFVVVDRLFDEKVVVVNKGRRQKMFFFQEYILNKGGGERYS